MGVLRVVMLGDIVGMPGVAAVRAVVPVIRQRWSPDLLIANAENAADGSGLTPTLYDKLREAGVEAMTLGDHVFKKKGIVSKLETEATLIRPANLSAKAAGRGWMKLTPASGGGKRNLYVTTVLGRLFLSLPADDPFAAVDRVLGELPEKNPLVLVEAHMEATSEKIALGYYVDGRVAAVVGTHTHVATADARILRGGTGFITDLGMSGPHESIIGRNVEAVVHQMTTAMHAPFDVAAGDVKVNGVCLDLDEATGRCVAIERIELVP